MQLLHDGLHDFTAPTFPAGSHVRCRVRLYGDTSPQVAVLTEIADNRGASVTNAAEPIATQLAQTLGMEVGDLAWVEHYPTDPAWRPFAETVDQVEYVADGLWVRPQWRHLGREGFAALTGGCEL